MMNTISNPTVRLATLDDLGAIVDIYNEAVAEQRTADTEATTVVARRDWFDHHTDPTRQRPLWVADISSSLPQPAIAGWISLSEYRPGRKALRHTAEVSYYVRSSHRRQGVARTMMRAAIERAPACDIHTLFAILLADNAPSIALLEQLGFARWALLPRVAQFGPREVDQVYYGARVGHP